jgi:hypothetical protein
MKLGTKARSLSSLEKIADKWFSLYIRLRDADENGMVKCVTCGKVAHYKEMDCGHFVTRNHKVTRYYEENCHPQDTFCNRYKHGEQYLHGQYIDLRHGDGTAEYLMFVSKQPVKRTRTDFEYLINEYKQKAREQADKLGIKI